MNLSMLLENQLLTTKFFVPVAAGPLISRPRLMSLLDENWKYPLTLVSAAAGFGKTTLLSAWAAQGTMIQPISGSRSLPR